MNKIFIPKKCRVGFQEREDTFAKKLAYVIYYDAKGKLRKEPSWEQWRHKPGQEIGGYDYTISKPTKRPLNVDVTPYDFENVPTSGFVLNKGHTRYPWGSFGQRRTVIRIYDPRGIEFEITPENLVGLLMHTDCSHREIQDDLVYAWCGGELMLLPCSSEEYQSAVSYSSLQDVRVGANDLKEGYTYLTKNEEPLVYLGRHLWYEIKNKYDDETARVGKKAHIFYDPNWTGKDKYPSRPKFKQIKNIPNIVSKQISDSCHDDFASLVDEYLKTPESAKIVGWEKRPIPAKDWEKDWEKDRDSGCYYDRPSISAAIEKDGQFITITIARHEENRPWGYNTKKTIPSYDGPTRLSFKKHRVVNRDGSWVYYYNNDSSNHEIVTDRSKFFRLFAVFDNGLKKEWKA